MLTCTLFMAIDDVPGEAKAVRTGRHRGRRARERLASLQGPGQGRHRRVLESDNQDGAP